MGYRFSLLQVSRKITPPRMAFSANFLLENGESEKYACGACMEREAGLSAARFFCWGGKGTPPKHAAEPLGCPRPANFEAPKGLGLENWQSRRRSRDLHRRYGGV